MKRRYCDPLLQRFRLVLWVGLWLFDVANPPLFFLFAHDALAYISLLPGNCQVLNQPTSFLPFMPYGNFVVPLAPFSSFAEYVDSLAAGSFPSFYSTHSIRMFQRMCERFLPCTYDAENTSCTAPTVAQHPHPTLRALLLCMIAITVLKELLRIAG
jgi:hypothetical protein